MCFVFYFVYIGVYSPTKHPAVGVPARVIVSCQKFLDRIELIANEITYQHATRRVRLDMHKSVRTRNSERIIFARVERCLPIR